MRAKIKMFFGSFLVSRRSLSLKAFEELTLFNRAGTSKQLALTLICTKLSDKDVKLLIDKITAKS